MTRINDHAANAGAMGTGLDYILERLADAERRLTDLRAGLPGTADYESAQLLTVTDDLAQLADYITGLRTRTAGPPTTGGETSTAQVDPQPVSWGFAVLDGWERVS